MRKRFVFTLICSALLAGAKAEGISKINTAEKTKTVQEKDLVLEIAPGPINKELVVSFTEAGSGAAMTITDLKGIKMLSVPVETGASKASINVSKLSSGTYFLVFTSGESRTSKLFVKQ